MISFQQDPASFGEFTGVGPDPLDAFDALQSMHTRFTQMRTDMQELRRRAQAHSMDLPESTPGTLGAVMYIMGCQVHYGECQVH